jgi:hypothetical protein
MKLCKDNKEIKIQKIKNEELRIQLVEKYFIKESDKFKCIRCNWETKRFYYAIYHKFKCLNKTLKRDCKSCIELSIEEINNWKQLFETEELKEDDTIV